MKLNMIVIFAMAGLAGCAQLSKGEMQPVEERGANTYYTTCSGTVEEWSSCNRKARNTCKNGYEVLNKFETAVGGRREMTFQCNGS